MGEPVRSIWKVTLAGRKRPVKVTAQYHRIGDRGELIFRDGYANGYPVPVLTIAHGQWIAVRLEGTAK